ncbi:MAG: 4-hydroxythreonine-4-phosphate dehydrogenase PdxA [Chloroflexi bacterium]|nr:4-hydroxythreonine-4-phosphate dehydrogenase PdxA [Chloroflexota bacterium]
MNTQKPVIAVTMGDPAGIGPEICVDALLDRSIYEICNPFIIGSRSMLEIASKILNKEIQVNLIDDPWGANCELGVINVYEPGKFDTSALLFGQVQRLAGQMAYDWIKASIELGLKGKVDGVATCPINKQAIRLAGIKEAGHTEIFQELTRSPYALTMFSCHQLRVFFLSRHMSLLDACRYVTKENTLEMLRLVDKELKQAGFLNPLIAVAALNPHGSDDGLFGNEEKDALVPAVEAAQLLGINAIGPIPADSVFHIGKSGAYDAILSLYHDQGHIATKTLDFERTVTLTLGLPFIRGSVDHGTAFDIAGQGKASAVSLVEAIKVVAEYARKKSSE